MQGLFSYDLYTCIPSRAKIRIKRKRRKRRERIDLIELRRDITRFRREDQYLQL